MKRTDFLKGNVVCFKQWKGNSYAIFNSLHRVLKIGTLMAAYFCLFGIKQTFAQVDTTSINKKINLEEVEVSARRSPSVYSEVGRVLHVISRKEIESLPVYSVQDLLRYALNVDVRQRGPLGIQADVSIRGGSFDQVMILFNGINVTDPQTGHLSLNLPVSMQSIERVEILEGPGARVYGPGAFSGAINFVTGSKKNDNITVNALAGQHGLYNVAANTTINTGKLKSYVAADMASSDGYIQNTDFKNHSLFYQGQLGLGNSKLDFQLGHNNKAFGANAFYTPKYPDQFEQNKTTFTSLKLTSGKKVKVTPAIYWRRHQDRFELFREKGHYEKNDDGLYVKDGEVAGFPWEDKDGNPQFSPYKGHNHHLTNVYGGNINVVIPWFLGKTSVGSEVRSENILSNNIGHDMDDTKPVPGEDDVFTKSYDRMNTSIFLEHMYSYQKLSVSLGVLLNWNSSIESDMPVFPGLDVSYWLNDRVKLFGSINNSLRLPTFTDLFYSGPTNEGNPDLKPEEAWTYEGGVKYSNRWASAQASYFYRNADNLIDWGKKEGEVKYKTRNLSAMKSHGITLQGRIDLKELLNQDYLKSFDIGYSAIDQDKNSIPGYQSAYVMDYLKTKVNFGLNARLISKLELAVNVLYQDRNGGYDAYVLVGEEYVEIPTDYKPFWLTDLRLQWTEKKFKVFADANNLFDIQYYDLGNVPQPGRWMKIGAQVSLDW